MLGLLTVQAALNEYGRAGLMHDFQAKLRDLTSAFRLAQSAAVPLVSADGELNSPSPLESAVSGPPSRRAAVLETRRAFFFSSRPRVVFTAIVVADFGVPLGVPLDFDLTSACAHVDVDSQFDWGEPEFEEQQRGRARRLVAVLP